jgi:hypothetical protein
MKYVVKVVSSILLLSILFVKNTKSQDIIEGTNGYVTYQQGTLPIVISVPHGGSLMPDDIPDRTCNDPVYFMDANTIEVANALNAALFEATGCYPHIIYNYLHRRKLDCNRNLTDGACGNAQAMTAWNEFHDFIAQAQATANNDWDDNIFFVDLHGHGNEQQRIELGYLLYEEELEESDAVLNTSTFISYSTIQNLVVSNLENQSHAQLLRGPQSMGSLLAAEGYPSVPSAEIPAPGIGSNYFSGGYIVANHTCYQDELTTNGVQVELNFDGIRDNESNRQLFATRFAAVILNYLDIHRGVDASSCSSLNALESTIEEREFSIFPNPVPTGLRVLYVEGFNSKEAQIELRDSFGRLVQIYKNLSSELILPNQLASGVYYLVLRDDQIFSSKRIIVY